VVNSTSLIHVYGHVRVTRCMIFKVKLKDRKLVRCLMDMAIRVCGTSIPWQKQKLRFWRRIL
jgi:hypothetical protein